jgi:asparagine synthase (glutamine-hydrolysing)
LPEAILNRPKQGFSSALPYMLKEEYRLLLELFQRDSHFGMNDVFRQSTINNLLDEHQSRRVDHGNRLWLLLNSEIWYRMFIESTSATELADGLTEAKSTLELVART